jgi:[acyl-carrier-protein] S-malonyltransferase
VPLRVAGAFHSHCMAEAAARFGEELTRFRFRDPRVGLVCGSSGRVLRDGQEVRQRLGEAILAPVRWDRFLRGRNTVGTTWIEVGPGKALDGMVRLTDRSAAVFTTGTASSLQVLLGTPTARCTAAGEPR